MGIHQSREEGDLAEVRDAGPLAGEVGEAPHPGHAVPLEEDGPVVDRRRGIGDDGPGAQEEWLRGHGGGL